MQAPPKIRLPTARKEARRSSRPRQRCVARCLLCPSPSPPTQRARPNPCLPASPPASGTRRRWSAGCQRLKWRGTTSAGRWSITPRRHWWCNRSFLIQFSVESVRVSKFYGSGILRRPDRRMLGAAFNVKIISKRPVSWAMSNFNC